MARSAPVIVLGAGGHALVVAEILRMNGWRIAGFVDEMAPERRGEAFGGDRILGGWEQLTGLATDGVLHAIVAVGHCAARVRIAAELTRAGFALANAIHPSAAVSTAATLGVGCVVAAQAAVNPGAHLGDNVIVNTGATVDHECEIGSGVHVGPGVHLAGRVRIGDGTWIGIGTTVSDRIAIGTNAFIGAGSVVLKDIPGGMLAYGVPARVIRRADT